jgi:Protein of unknown function (DUF3102)
MTNTELVVAERPPNEVSAPFDYSTFDADVADQMRDHANRICKIQRASVLEVGRELTAAKELVEHRCFARWLRTACQMHIRTAERAMLAAKLVEKNDNLSYLAPDGLLALASRSAPEPVVSRIIGEIAAGVRPSAAEIKRRIAEDKKTEKRAREQTPAGGEAQDGEYSPTGRAAATVDLIEMLLALRYREAVVFSGCCEEGQRSGAAAVSPAVGVTGRMAPILNGGDDVRHRV